MLEVIQFLSNKDGSRKYYFNIYYSRLKKKNIRLQKEHEEVTKYFKEKQGEILKLEYEIDGLHQDLQFSEFKQKFCGKNNFLDFSSQPRSM